MLIGIVGRGGFAREVAPILRRTAPANSKIVFVDKYLSEPEVNGLCVQSEQEFLDQKCERWFNIAIADGATRQRLSESFISAGAIPLSIKDPSHTSFDANDVGEGAILCANSVITSNVKIGRFFHCNLGAYVAHDCVVGNFVTFAPRASCNGNVYIEDHAYIGTGAVIKDGKFGNPIRIGRGAVVGMGSVVTRDIPAGETWIGNPARPLHRRASK